MRNMKSSPTQINVPALQPILYGALGSRRTVRISSWVPENFRFRLGWRVLGNRGVTGAPQRNDYNLRFLQLA
jgi:hypothetical protein